MNPAHISQHPSSGDDGSHRQRRNTQERKPQACVNTGQHGPIKDVYTWGEKVRFWTTRKKIMNIVIKYV